MRLVMPPPMITNILKRNRFYGLGTTRPDRCARTMRGLGATTSSAAPIPDTGMRGFLKWVRREYPPQIYQQIAAQVQQQIPQAFGTYMLGGWRQYAKLSGLADAGADTVDTADAANSGASSPTWSDQVSQIIGTLTGSYLAVNQQQQQANIINAQLTQAQAGRAPYNISLGGSGITFASQGQFSGGEVLVLGGLALLVLKALKAF